ncbi:hypothetical protein HPB47_015320 [Ixodes persulcatus]|uniref:Uncharacterized protein n=1 Tax=Ixodes persulcatus TaxID=34615 RepID=A0AC60QUN6_IXOPE|nr:hypothetical protein HPB47_015320 [Ixodes persulcatus]
MLGLWRRVFVRCSRRGLGRTSGSFLARDDDHSPKRRTQGSSGASSQGLLQAHLFRPAIVPPAIRGFPGPGGAVKNGTFGNLLPSFNAAETSPKTSPDVFRTDAHLSKAAQNVSQRVRDVNGTCVCCDSGFRVCSERGASFETTQLHIRDEVVVKSCTDIICLFLFVFFLVGWGIVAFFAYRNGNPERLIYPTDSQGNICGKAPFEDKKYLYFFDITKCLQRAYKPGDLLPSLICNTPQVCVEHCPNETFSVDNAKGSKDELRSKLICQYGVNPLDTSVTVDDLVNKDQRCAKYYLKSSSVARRCLPGRLVKEGDQLKDELNGGIISAFSASGISKNTKVLAGLSSAKDAGELAFQDFKTAWPLMLIGLLAAMVVAFLWIVLMRWLATIMVWLSILCLIVLFSFGSYYSFSKYVELRKGSDSSGGNLVQDFDVSISFTQNLRAYTANKNTWLFLGIVSAVILLILLILLIFLRKRIVIAIALIKEASRAVALMPSALFFPLLPYLLHLLLFAFWGSVAVYLASSGKADYKYMNMTAGNESMTTKDCTFEDVNKTSTIDGLKCQFAQYITNQHLSRAQIYNVIGLIWGMFFIVGLGQVALAAAFASYYWAFRKPQDVPFFAVLNGLCLTLR